MKEKTEYNINVSNGSTSVSYIENNSFSTDFLDLGKLTFYQNYKLWE